MITGRMGVRAVALVSATMATVVAAQVEPKVDLMQITIENPSGQADAAFAARAKEFGRSMALVTSCDQAMGVAMAMRAGVVGRGGVPLSALPLPLRREIETKPVGTPSRPFGDLKGLRVLMRCPAQFRPPRPRGTPTPKPAI